MKEALRKTLQTHEFQPGWVGLLTNPFYITRKGLSEGISAKASHFKGRVLDYGCGEKPYRDVFHCDEYIGVDTKNSGHGHRQQNNVDVFFDGKTLPFEKEYFDGAFASEVLEHLFHPERTLAEIHRVLKPRGLVLLTTPFCWDEHEVPFDFARYTSYGLKDLLDRNGFEIVEHEKVGGFLQTILQLLCLYFYYKTQNLSLKWKVLLFPITLWPWNLLSQIPFKNPSNTFYLSHVVLARKK